MLLDELAISGRPQLSEERAEFRRLFLAGDYAEARRLAERCFARGAERVAWLQNLASVALAQGNTREAYSLLLTNEGLLADCRDLYSVGNFHLCFGVACKRLYELHGSEHYFDRASVEFAAATDAFERAGHQESAAYSENCYANLLIAAYRPASAFEHIDRAQLLFNDAFEFARSAEVEDTRALAFEALGRYVDAFECASRAVVALERCGASEGAALKQARATARRVFEKMTGEESGG